MVIMNMGEKSGQRTANQSIPEINDDCGLKCTDNEKINPCIRKFYQLLYTSDVPTNPVVLEDFFKSLKMPSVGAELSAELERDFSVREIVSAIGAVPSGKSPGPDGFSTKFTGEYRPVISFAIVSIWRAFSHQLFAPNHASSSDLFIT